VPSLARRLLLPAVLLTALSLPASALAACPGAGDAPAAPSGPAATLCLLNAERAAQGLGPLAADAALQRAATAFAQDMVTRRFFDHTSPDGGTMLDRLKAGGWLPASGAWTAGENIAWGAGDVGTPARIVAAWMASPGHRANILQAAFTQIGLGIVAGAPQAGVSGAAATYVTDFGSRPGPGAGAGAPAAPSRSGTPAAAPAAASRCAPAAPRAAKRTSKRAPRRCARR
jgi:uncharacterized protein YkwD